MSSEIKADKWSPASGTSATIGDSGDTYTVPTGANFTVTDELKTNKISPASGTSFTLGDSGDTFTIPAGATITNSGTATGFGANTPSFLVNISSAQSIPTSSVTKIQFDTEVFDTDSAFNTGSYRFTPQVAGKYVIGIHVSLNSSADFDQNFIQINKNGSNVFQSYYENKYYNGHSGETVIVFNGSTDYVDFYIHQSRGGATELRPDTFCTFAYGYKLIGV